jgi:hypothetical protein
MKEVFLMNLLFLDTETGGLDPWKHSLLQIGLVAYKNGIKDTLKINLRLPEYGVTVEAMKYNGISLSLDPRRACHAITNFIRNNFAENPILAGFNLSLDKYMLSRLLKEYYVGLDLDEAASGRHAGILADDNADVLKLLPVEFQVDKDGPRTEVLVRDWKGRVVEK